MTSETIIDNTPRTRRLVQAVCDLRGNVFDGCRIADLGCAHGALGLEFARRGASVVGIEGRDHWLGIAEGLKRDLGLHTAEFLKGDARDLDAGKIGRFDVVICAGLLYHFDSPEVFEVVRRVHDLCTDFAVFDTHIALHAKREVVWEGHTYSGMSYREHEPSASEQQRMEALGASLDNDWSFWLTKPSLLNLLHRVGFSSVLEIQNPISHVYEGDEVRFHPDLVSLVAFKGQPIEGAIGAVQARIDRFEDWPEGGEGRLLGRPHAGSQAFDTPDERAPPPRIDGRARLTSRLFGLGRPREPR